MTSVSLMYDAGHPKPVLCDDLEEWGEEGDEKGNFHKMGIFMWFIFFFVWEKRKLRKFGVF